MANRASGYSIQVTPMKINPYNNFQLYDLMIEIFTFYLKTLVISFYYSVYALKGEGN